MNDMTPFKTPLQRFSTGEISRIELGRLMGKPVAFGDMLGMLHEAHLPLPRYNRPLNPAGMALLKSALERNAHD
jgi:hypothetical protein